MKSLAGEATDDLSRLPETASRVLVATYSRPPIVITRGEGVHLFDHQGRRYLDMASGIAVTALGHNDPGWIQAVTDQATTLTHVSNLFHSAPHILLAQRLVEHSFAERAFFSNSGAEANEAALKFARKFARLRHGQHKFEVVAFEGGFHGRTMGALSLTYKRTYRDPFAPLVPGVTFVAFNDLDAAAQAIGPNTCAVFIEPIQGEAGVHPADPTFLQGLRALCDRHGALLVMDEVQCGLGRAGHLWAYQAYGVVPDILTLAKPLAGGLPIGATLVTEPVALATSVGDHGSTFGGGPLVCRAALAVLDRILSPGFVERVEHNGARLRRLLEDLASPYMVEVRGAGLLVGVEFDRPVGPVIDAALQRGLVVIPAGERVIRICPPLTISAQQIEHGVNLLADALDAVGWSAGA